MLENLKLLITKAYKSKTLIVSYALAIGGVVEANTSALAPYLSHEHFGLFMMIFGVVMAVLRMGTTQPLGDK